MESQRQQMRQVSTVLSCIAAPGQNFIDALHRATAPSVIVAGQLTLLFIWMSKCMFTAPLSHINIPRYHQNKCGRRRLEQTSMNPTARKHRLTLNDCRIIIAAFATETLLDARAQGNSSALRLRDPCQGQKAQQKKIETVHGTQHYCITQADPILIPYRLGFVADDLVILQILSDPQIFCYSYWPNFRSTKYVPHANYSTHYYNTERTETSRQW